MVGRRNSLLAEERAEVEVLSAQAEVYADIGKKMRATLQRMQQNQLSELVGPTQSETQQLQTMEKSRFFPMPFLPG
jgi:hypothetical protein